jgi:hypothetical protein
MRCLAGQLPALLSAATWLAVVFRRRPTFSRVAACRTRPGTPPPLSPAVPRCAAPAGRAPQGRRAAHGPAPCAPPPGADGALRWRPAHHRQWLLLGPWRGRQQRRRRRRGVSAPGHSAMLLLQEAGARPENGGALRAWRGAPLAPRAPAGQAPRPARPARVRACAPRARRSPEVRRCRRASGRQDGGAVGRARKHLPAAPACMMHFQALRPCARHLGRAGRRKKPPLV